MVGVVTELSGVFAATLENYDPHSFKFETNEAVSSLNLKVHGATVMSKASKTEKKLVFFRSSACARFSGTFVTLCVLLLLHELKRLPQVDRTAV